MPLSWKHQHDAALLEYTLYSPPLYINHPTLPFCSHATICSSSSSSSPLLTSYIYTHSYSLMKMSPAGSTRWCPTPEQLMILEEMYRSGVRTPNASQIQNITTHLSYYGKIEGKNVFYWFQNHKARERQKLRRKLGKQLLLQQQQQQQQQHQLKHFQVLPNHPHHQLFHCFHSPPAAAGASSSLSFYIPQEGLTEEEASSKMMNYTWKQGIQENAEIMEKPLNKGMFSRDWMMFHSLQPPPCCSTTRPPLKTLELFPITATNLKEECNNNNNNNSSSSSSSSKQNLSLL